MDGHKLQSSVVNMSAYFQKVMLTQPHFLKTNKTKQNKIPEKQFFWHQKKMKFQTDFTLKAQGNLDMSFF